MSIKTTTGDLEQFLKDKEYWANHWISDSLYEFCGGTLTTLPLDDLDTDEVVEIKRGTVFDNEAKLNISLIDFFKKWQEKVDAGYAASPGIKTTVGTLKRFLADRTYWTEYRLMSARYLLGGQIVSKLPPTEIDDETQIEIKSGTVFEHEAQFHFELTNFFSKWENKGRLNEESNPLCTDSNLSNPRLAMTCVVAVVGGCLLLVGVANLSNALESLSILFA